MSHEYLDMASAIILMSTEGSCIYQLLGGSVYSVLHEYFG